MEFQQTLLITLGSADSVLWLVVVKGEDELDDDCSCERLRFLIMIATPNNTKTFVEQKGLDDS